MKILFLRSSKSISTMAQFCNPIDAMCYRYTGRFQFAQSFTNPNSFEPYLLTQTKMDSDPYLVVCTACSGAYTNNWLPLMVITLIYWLILPSRNYRSIKLQPSTLTLTNASENVRNLLGDDAEAETTNAYWRNVSETAMKAVEEAPDENTEPRKIGSTNREYKTTNLH